MTYARQWVTEREMSLGVPGRLSRSCTGERLAGPERHERKQAHQGGRGPGDRLVRPLALGLNPEMAMLERIQAFNRARGGGVVVQKAARGYSLLSERSGALIARLRPIGDADKVEVLWWNGERWRASGSFGTVTMPLDEAVDYIAPEPALWIHV